MCIRSTLRAPRRWTSVWLALAVLLAVAVCGFSHRAFAQQEPERGWLGAGLQDLTPQSIRALGLTQEHAILVVYSIDGSPAQKAGLHTADVIVQLDGKPVPALPEFVTAIQQLGSGRDARLDLWRRGERLTLSVKLGGSSEARSLTTAPEFTSNDSERKIEAFLAISNYFSKERFVELWAATQIFLGHAYQARVLGDGADNLEKAIAAYEAALTVHTREAMPVDWAMIQQCSSS